MCDERGRAVRAASLPRWLARVVPRRVRGAVSIALVSDARMRALNREYRGKDYATDVLSFAAETRGKGSQPWLGDIVIARSVAARQAREAGHSEATELKILALHGLLHLLGYDHERDNGQMRRTERRLLSKGGLDAGLIERS